ncbi:hypothetical protein N5E02_04930 [Stenotrophomonas sp. GD03777]|uniref:hypothetical protein n=1 Tax=Stenotrophomonas sp. GD03777 TaxID=2975380 RepID=UPI00244CCEE1|nr:hypothetical protein [Stenotrophomonas sp. GD03777]MDH1660758.1 hypothetical protein [Stenotrophomonas sp. GD03777]
MDQAAWATWIQVVAAVVGIVLALYIPVRMKRLEDFERVRAVAARVEGLKRLRDAFQLAMTPDTQIPEPPMTEFGSLHRGCTALIEDPLTEADFLPVIGRILDVSKEMAKHWERRRYGPVTRISEVAYINDVCARFDAEQISSEAIVSKWRRKHWLALAFH